ncbi:protein CASPARIAN STRIP INTEGRITY FACTOR 1-like isoform X1 [Tasmannia lanceolata]|uniref:protein CASPARIAN STRIP INTEGRITY FACTOR 1-like isoform X1 n=1 Tax=Tasmannia lanceolata TaxID=3420 RepID=UPI00406341BA
MMGFIAIKKITLLFILISASLLSTSFAGGKLRFMDKNVIQVGAKTKEISEKPMNNEKSTHVHERILKVHTKDYDNYDPAPALGKPPFKLIPN